MSTIFVGGAQRSGTNLMQTILCQDATTNHMMHEARYLTAIMSAYAWAKDNFANNTRDYFATPHSVDVFHRQLLEQLMENVRALHGETEHLVLKHPELSPYFSLLCDLLVDPLFIVMIRDPRDTITSMIKVQEKLSATAQPADARNITSYCEHFLSYYERLLASTDEAFKKRVLFVRYEDLVRAPAHVLASVSQFCGLELSTVDVNHDFDTGTLDYEQAGPEWQAWITEHYGKGISSVQVGSFQSVLGPGEVTEIESRCQSYFNTFGYNQMTG